MISLKTKTTDAQNVKTEKEKDRIKISELLRQRTGLESELNKCKGDMFQKNKEIITQRAEIDKLKKQLADQKVETETQKANAEKYRDLYSNSKAAVTPFSDSRMDNMTEDTQGIKKTPTDMKADAQKQPHDIKPIDKKIEQLTQSKSENEKAEIERKLEDIQVVREEDEEVQMTPCRSQSSSSQNDKTPSKGYNSPSDVEYEEKKFESTPDIKESLPVIDEPTPLIKGAVQISSEEGSKPELSEIVEMEESPLKQSENKHSDVDSQVKMEETPVKETPHRTQDSPLSLNEVKTPKSENPINVEEGKQESNRVSESTEPIQLYEEANEIDEKILELEYEPSGSDKEDLDPLIQVNKPVTDLMNNLKGDEPKSENINANDSSEDDVLINEKTPSSCIPQQESKKSPDKPKNSPETPQKEDKTKPPESFRELESDKDVSEEESDHPRSVYKSRVSIKHIPSVVNTEFKLILQNKKIPFEKMRKIFPPSKRIRLDELIEHFKSFNRFENIELLEKICRYLVEMDTEDANVLYSKDADIDKIAIGNSYFNF